MQKNKEVEYKILLNEETFQKISNAYPSQTVYSQTNYYLTSDELSEKHYALRIREKNHTFEMTLKIPDGFAKMEHNQMISEDDFKKVESGQIINNDITALLKNKGIDPAKIRQEYSLKTIRHDIALTYGMLSLDENFYNGHHDYEFEFEVNNEEKGAEQFKELLKKFNLSYTHNCDSKIVRVLKTLK